jgi:selenoprotein W-related protein
LTDEILGIRELEAHIASWKLVPSRGGVFELEVNGELLFSKLALGRHAEPGEIRALIERKLDEARSGNIS